MIILAIVMVIVIVMVLFIFMFIDVVISYSFQPLPPTPVDHTGPENPGLGVRCVGHQSAFLHCCHNALKSQPRGDVSSCLCFSRVMYQSRTFAGLSVAVLHRGPKGQE